MASPAALAPPVPRDPPWLRCILAVVVAAYIAILGTWAFSAGMNLRGDAWIYSRTIRYHDDIANGMHWGNNVLRAADQFAEHPEHLTVIDLIHGEDQVYQNLVTRQPVEGDYGLDYPPLRLMVMTLWTRHVQEQFPGLQGWPGNWQLTYSAGGNPNELANEDIARPMLLLNAYCIAVAAVIAALLVGLWVYRGGRPNLPGKKRGPFRRNLHPWRPVLLRHTNGLVVFAICAPAFFYAVSIAEMPTPPGPPTVTLTTHPLLASTSDGKKTAIITATIDGQGSVARWYVEWGTTLFYGHQTALSDAGADDVTAAIPDLPPHSIIHYRFTARNDLQTTRSDDATINTADGTATMPSSRVYGAVWISWPRWVLIGLLFLAMIGAIQVMPPAHRAWAAALVAMLLMWFDPVDLVDSYIWPQWDVWVLPPFLLAALLASLDAWLLAGMVLGFGIMFKGQMLLICPLLLLWPLFSMRWGAVLRLVIGFVTMAGVILSPWLVLGNGPAVWSAGPLRWIAGILAAACIAAALSIYRRPLWRSCRSAWAELRGRASTQRLTSLFDLTLFCASLLAAIVIITVLILRRWPLDSELPRSAGLFLLLAILLPPWFLPRRALTAWIVAILGSSIWMSAYLYHGDWSWKTVGFEYGTRKQVRMALGDPSNGNLAKILDIRFGWDVHDTALTLRLPDVADSLHLAKRGAYGAMLGWPHDWGLDGTPLTLDIRQLMMLVFITLMVLTGIGAAMQSRRNHPRLIASLIAIWVLLPNALCQMTERYQIWSAAVSCMAIAIAPGLTLLHVVISLLGAGIIAARLLRFDPARSPMLYDLMTRWGPDDGWILVLIGCIFLYVALSPGRRPLAKELS